MCVFSHDIYLPHTDPAGSWRQLTLSPSRALPQRTASCCHSGASQSPASLVRPRKQSKDGPKGNGEVEGEGGGKEERRDYRVKEGRRDDKGKGKRRDDRGKEKRREGE